MHRAGPCFELTPWGACRTLSVSGYSKPHSPALSRALRSRPQDYLTGAACRFCERIIPVQLTCGLTAQALKGAAARIAALHSREVVQAAAGSPIKLAVTYKGRGSGSKDRKSPVDRSLAIAIVADAVEDAVKRCGGTVKVDLKSPQVVMMVEVLPITPSPICALCWLPGTMTQANKLLVKPMVAPER